MMKDKPPFLPTSKIGLWNNIISVPTLILLGGEEQSRLKESNIGQKDERLSKRPKKREKRLKEGRNTKKGGQETKKGDVIISIMIHEGPLLIFMLSK